MRKITVIPPALVALAFCVWLAAAFAGEDIARQKKTATLSGCGGYFGAAYPI